jgi:DNA-directed RNA polymerase specialized sigma24 family protein
MTTGDSARTQPRLKREWTPSPAAFHQFLSWLDGGIESNGERYLEMRRRLEDYFWRKRCEFPDRLADDVLNRVARRLEEEGGIPDPPARYCYIVARFVFLESLRSAERLHVELPAEVRGPDFSDSVDSRLECLEKCIMGLPAGDRDLIVQYYPDEQRSRLEHRRELAARLSLTPNALAIKACRIRARLERCVDECLKRQ